MWVARLHYLLFASERCRPLKLSAKSQWLDGQQSCVDEQNHITQRHAVDLSKYITYSWFEWSHGTKFMFMPTYVVCTEVFRKPGKVYISCNSSLSPEDMNITASVRDKTTLWVSCYIRTNSQMRMLMSNFKSKFCMMLKLPIHSLANMCYQ